MRHAGIQLDHLVLAENGCWRPVIAEPAFLALVGLGDRAIQSGSGSRVNQDKTLFLSLPRLEGVGGGDLASPSGRAVVHGALLLVIREGEQLRMGQCVVDGLDLRVRVGKVLGNPPAFDAPVLQRTRCVMQASLLHGRVERFPGGVDPGFRRDIRLPFLHHGRQGRHGVARNNFDIAAVTLVEYDSVDGGKNFGGLPVHACDGDTSAFGVGA